MELTTFQLFGASGAGLLAGTLSGFFGVGGNVILIPLLALALGLTQHQAQGLTLAALLPPLNLPAVISYRRAGVPLSWRLVGFTMLGFLVAVPLGSWLANGLPATALRLVFAVLLLMTAVRMFREKPTAREEQTGASAALPAPAASAIGASAGLASGLLGIGGAILLIPLLRRFARLSQKEAQLTSLAMLLPPVALPGVIVYAREQTAMPWVALLPVAGGFVVGSILGARLNRVVSPERLTRGFGVLLLVSALVLGVTALRS